MSTADVQGVESRQGRAEALLRRQLVLTGLGVAVVVIVMAFVRTQSLPAVSSNSPVDVYVRAHHPPDAGSLHLAYLQLGVAAAVALVTLSHAVGVVAFVFRKEVR
ncbi:MAG: hypothetical protein QOK43_3051 [Acidimicrobiaceae bacterium]|jgi:uncharacterized membrane protein|nr:hypothetical protein [Acidimicrobiaceae bacterium]MDQ1444772.1 hypothetical protein [Acidimicrobiaceae bacterium]